MKPILVIRTRQFLTQEEYKEIGERLTQDYHVLFCKSNNDTDSFKVLNGRISKKTADRIIKECKKLEL